MNCNFLCAYLPSEPVPLWGGPALASPLYHSDFDGLTSSIGVKVPYFSFSDIESGFAPS